MTEYIDRKQALNALLFAMNGTGYQSMAIREIKAIPAEDVAPVVHSRFVNMGGFPACKHCGASPGTWEPKPNNPSGFPPYCYACGCKMDKEAEDAK